MHNAQCIMHNAQCIMHNAQFTNISIASIFSIVSIKHKTLTKSITHSLPNSNLQANYAEQVRQ